MEGDCDKFTVKRELLWNMYSNLQKMIEHADQKAQSNILVASILAALANYVIGNSDFWLINILVNISILLLLISIIMSIMALIARIPGDCNTNLFMFTSYALDKTTILDKLNKYLGNVDLYLEDFLKELKDLSNISKRKYKYVNCSFYLLLIAIILLFIIIIIFIIN